ncbi:hypothetical protein [Methylobacterium nigriterrae]|uniref:hypothetical protein n=1 Tax=Methylobacterium nigriterrae TaxID=3127512 RepID=UPI0030140DC8
MSFEAYIFCDKVIHSVSEWQRHINDLGFPVRIESSRELMSSKGHLPAVWSDREVGFEFGPIDRDDVIETYDDVDLGGPWTHAFALYWNTLPGFIGAWVCAAAYAKAVNGIVFDPQESLVLHPIAAARHAQAAIDTLPKIEALAAAKKRT